MTPHPTELLGKDHQCDTQRGTWTESPAPFVDPDSSSFLESGWTVIMDFVIPNIIPCFTLAF